MASLITPQVTIGMTSFGTFSRDRMKHLGKSQKALAEELGVSPAYISQVFSGKKKPPDLGRPKCRILLKKWSKFLEVSEDDILDMVRYDLHRVPPRPQAKFPQMRNLLVKRLDSRVRGLSEEIRSMSLHPAENRSIQAMVQIYLVLQDDIQGGSAYGSTRFRDFCCRVRANRDFVEGELTGFFEARPFTWSWDPDAGDVGLASESSEIRQALERVRLLLDRNPGFSYCRTIPVVGHVSAGQGFEYTDGGFTAGEGFEQVELPPGTDPSLAEILYCVRVRGDSLRDFFCDGALLFIKPESWEEIKDGDLVIFKDRKDLKAFVKKVEFAGDSLILKSMNPLYKNMVVRRSDLALLERVMAIVL
jgi:phage repressor protein C with HTH and peptisase S24 domain/transcriptional regulator with XRE-family HTH domain